MISGAVPGIIRKLDKVTGAVITDIVVGNDGRGICYDGTFLWTANYDLSNIGPANTITKVDPATDTVLATLTVGSHPVWIAYDETDSIWVACTGSTNVYKINIFTNVVTAIPLGNTAGSCAYDGHGYVWFSGPSLLKKVRITTNVVTTISTLNLYGICGGGGYIWGADFGTAVYKIDAATNAQQMFTSPYSPTRRPGFDGTNLWVPCGDSGHTLVVNGLTGGMQGDVNNTAPNSNRTVSFDQEFRYAYIASGNEIVVIEF